MRHDILESELMKGDNLEVAEGVLADDDLEEAAARKAKSARLAAATSSAGAAS